MRWILGEARNRCGYPRAGACSTAFRICGLRKARSSALDEDVAGVSEGYEGILKELKDLGNQSDGIIAGETVSPINVGLILDTGKILTPAERAILKILYNSKSFTIDKVYRNNQVRRRVFTPDGGRYADLRYGQIHSAKSIRSTGIKNWILCANSHNFNEYMNFLGDLNLVVDLNGLRRLANGWCYGFSEFIPPESQCKYILNSLISCPSPIATGVILAIGPIKHIIDSTIPVIAFAACGGSMIDMEREILLVGNTPGTDQSTNEFRSYHPTGHHSEVECSFRMEKFIRVIPHCASWKNGLYMTLSVNLSSFQTLEGLVDRYEVFYEKFPLITVADSKGFVSPRISRVLNTANVEIGGFSLQKDGRRLVVSAALDSTIRGGPYHAISCIALFNDYKALKNVNREFLEMGI